MIGGVEKAVPWFESVGDCGLVLPNGWFGRPFDNRHRVTYLEHRAFWFFLEFDERVLLVFREPGRFESSGQELIIGDFSHLYFDWKGYGGGAGGVTDFTHGEVKFIRLP